MYQSHENRTCYFPPLLSNGEISFAPDAEGMIGYTMKDYAEKGVTSFDGIVVRSARRSGLCNNLGARLFPFGKFTFSEGAKLTSWNQSLTIEGGFFESNCQYEDGAGIDSQGFIHPDKNIYALRKTFTGISGTKKVSYDVTLCGYNENISEYMNVLYTKKQDGVGCIGFKMYGMSVFTGEIHAFVDTDFTVEPIENGIRLWFEVKDGETVSFYYCLEDNLGGVDFSKVLGYKSVILWYGECSSVG